jgi:hypothetical protein
MVCYINNKVTICIAVPYSVYNLNVVTKCECFICNTKFSSDILQGSNSYKFDDNHTQNHCSFHLVGNVQMVCYINNKVTICIADLGFVIKYI